MVSQTSHELPQIVYNSVFSWLLASHSILRFFLKSVWSADAQVLAGSLRGGYWAAPCWTQLVPADSNWLTLGKGRTKHCWQPGARGRKWETGEATNTKVTKDRSAPWCPNRCSLWTVESPHQCRGKLWEGRTVREKLLCADSTFPRSNCLLLRSDSSEIGSKKKCWAWEEGVTWTEAVLAFVFFSQHLTLFLISDTLNLSNLFCLRQ